MLRHLLHNDNRPTDNARHHRWEGIAECFGSHSARPQAVELESRYHNLLHHRDTSRRLLLGVLRLHAPPHLEWTVLDSVRTSTSLVVETGRSAIHRRDDSHVKDLLPLSVTSRFSFVLSYFSGLIYVMWWSNVDWELSPIWNTSPAPLSLIKLSIFACYPELVLSQYFSC